MACGDHPKRPAEITRKATFAYGAYAEGSFRRLRWSLRTFWLARLWCTISFLWTRQSLR